MKIDLNSEHIFRMSPESVLLKKFHFDSDLTIDCGSEIKVAEVYNDLLVIDDFIVNGDLNVHHSFISDSNIIVKGDLNVHGDLKIEGELRVNGVLNVKGDII